jgi:hypothetical protein
MAILTTSVGLVYADITEGINIFTKQFENNVKLQKSAMKNININLYGSCTVLTFEAMSMEINGTKFDDESSYMYGLLIASSGYYSNQKKKQGVPESFFEKNLKVYTDETKRDRNAFIKKYISPCQELALKLMTESR